MSLIDQLIQMKRSEEENDIIKMLDEFTLYDKLSSVTALGTLEESSAMQKRLPYMTKFLEGNFYQLSLAIMASHVLTHLEYELPTFIQEQLAGIPERTRKQLTLASESTVTPVFNELMMYDHDTEENYVVGVYTNEVDEEIKIIIITNPTGKEYIIYQGSYIETDENEIRSRNQSTLIHKDHVTKLNKGLLSIGNYSMAGNNHYPFAKYRKGDQIFYVSHIKQHLLRISTKESLSWDDEDENDSVITTRIPLTQEETNQIGLSRQSLDDFANTIAGIINRWEEEN